MNHVRSDRPELSWPLKILSLYFCFLKNNIDNTIMLNCLFILLVIFFNIL
jgi:hypothetical protein